VGKFITHRFAGPMFAFRKYVSDLSRDNNRVFKLRSGDEFRELEELARIIQTKLTEENAQVSGEYLGPDKIKVE
jgi:hypothetical protein